MTSRPWIRFGRAGGRPPADDELVTIAEDGTFEAHRTLGGRRIGRFAGSLPAADLRALKRGVKAVADAEDVTIPTPRDGATESLEVAGRRLRLGSNERAPAPWSALVRRLRDILRDVVVEHPVGALQLEPTPGGARLVHLGQHALDLDTRSVEVRVTFLDRDRVPMGRSTGGLGRRDGEDTGPSWTTVGSGWTADVALGEGEALPEGAVGSQILVTLRIRDGEALRTARLIAVTGEAGDPGS